MNKKLIIVSVLVYTCIISLSLYPKTHTVQIITNDAFESKAGFINACYPRNLHVIFQAAGCGYSEDGNFGVVCKTEIITLHADSTKPSKIPGFSEKNCWGLLKNKIYTAQYTWKGGQTNRNIWVYDPRRRTKWRHKKDLFHKKDVLTFPDDFDRIKN